MEETKDNIIGIIRDCVKNVIKCNDISVKKSVQEGDNNKKHIYNEISFQHELGIALRKALKENSKDYIVQFERNISSFSEFDKIIEQYKEIDIKDIFKKSEIDLVILNMNNNKEKYALELKYHREEDGRIPNTMYDCVKDMYFTKALVNQLDFCYAACVTIAEDTNFFSNEEKYIKHRKLQNYMYFEKDILDIKKRIDKKMEEYEKDKKDEKHPKNVVFLGKRSPLTKPLSVEEFYDSGILPVKWKAIFEEEKDMKNGAYYMIEF